MAFNFAKGKLIGGGGMRDAQLGAFAELLRAGELPTADVLRDDPDADLVALLRKTANAG